MKASSALVIVCVFIFFAGCGSEPEKIGEKDVAQVTVVEVRQESIEREVTVSGQFTTDDEAFLSFKTGGVIQSIFVKEGDAVRPGQILASLDLTEIRAGVAQAKAGYEKAYRDLQRVQNLYQDSVASLEQYENAKTAFEVAELQFNAAKFNLDYSQIRAVKPGYILKKFANEGQIVGPGMPILQTNGAGSGNWILRAGVSDREWASLKVGDKAKVTLDTRPGEVIAAVISRKSEGIDPFSGTFTVDLKVSVAAKDMLASGLFGKAKISPSEKIETYIIPHHALFEADGNTGYVFVSEDGKTAKRQRVIISMIEKEHVAVASGLEQAKYLIVGGSAYLKDGSSITINMAGK